MAVETKRRPCTLWKPEVGADW